MFYWIYDYASWKVGALFAFVFVGATGRPPSSCVVSFTPGSTVTGARTRWWVSCLRAIPCSVVGIGAVVAVLLVAMTWRFMCI
jgi:hypothetical protein